MIFEARRQSFKILLIIFLLGWTHVKICQAERSPVSAEGQNFYQNLLVNTDVINLAKVKLKHQRDNELWSKFKQFADEQALAVVRGLKSLELKVLWKQLSGLDVSPNGQQVPATSTEAGAISVTAVMVEMASNITALQWWQASNWTENFVDSGNLRVAQAKQNFDADIQTGLVQLVELTSVSVVDLVKSLQVTNVLQSITTVKKSGSPNADSLSKEDSLSNSSTTIEDPESDPYWQYYADCDFWGAQFEAADK